MQARAAAVALCPLRLAGWVHQRRCGGSVGLAAYTHLGAPIDYRFGNAGRFQLALWADNLTGVRRCVGFTCLAGLAESNICQPALSEPTIGLTFSLRTRDPPQR